MCINCKTIKSPKVESPHYVDGVDYHTLNVPCGHCEECKDLKRQGVYVRLFYEFQETYALNGYTVNITLTYNNDNLPYVEVPDENGEIEYFPCFNVNDIQKYIKRIRKSLSDRGFVDVYFTYFCAMELGGKTHRPHYHLLFFVKCSKMCVSAFVRTIREKWTLGYTACGNQGALVKDARMLNYAAKYVAKDAFEDEWYQPVLNRLKRFIKPKDKDLFNHIRKCLSGRFLASRGLGLYALKASDAYRLHRLQITVPVEGHETVVPLPLYLDRKLHYDVLYRDRVTGLVSDTRQKDDDVPTYVLNDVGMYYIKDRFKVKLEFITNRLKQFLNEHYSSELLENACKCCCNCSISELRKLIGSFFNLERLAAYSILYMHRRDYGTAYKDYDFVSSSDMLCDYMTLCNCSYRYFVGEYGAPYSDDANINAYRAHSSSAQREFSAVNANIFSFISYYNSQCSKHQYELKLEANKSYVYRKSLCDMFKYA